jgi:hypothetical protein
MWSTIEPVGAPTPLLILATSGLPLGLATDDGGRLWVAAPRPGDEIAFVVLDRR